MGALTRAAVIACIALSASAQVRESITVEVIDVPVYVIDRDGRAVRGLTRDAFTLLVDGKARPIDYFDTIDFGSEQQSPIAERPQRDRRLYLLLFDLTFAVPARLAHAQAAAEKAVDQSNSATDLFSVATYDSHRGVSFVTPFLLDRVAIKRALYTLRSSTSRDALGLTITKDEREVWKDLATPTDEASAAMLEAIMGGVANQEMASAPTARLIEHEFDAVGEAAKRLAAMEGQKHVLFFTQGFESSLVHGFGVGSGPPQIDANLMARMNDMHKRFRAAGVILDSIDIAGLRHTFDYRDNDALWLVARGTGGQVVVNKNDLVAGITDLTTAQQLVYLLGFRRTDNRAHRIDVRVKGAPRGSNIYYRTGFGEPQKASVDALQLADIMLNNVPQTGFEVALEVSSSADAVVRFSRAEVVPQLDEKTPAVDAMLYVFKTGGEIVASRAKRITFWPRSRAKGDIEVREHFDLPPGAYVAKALLRIEGTNVLAFARREFTVP
ncbi:MAG TPA: VWA domain-containing protein [Thermoanaerobaculia bacterium]